MSSELYYAGVVNEEALRARFSVVAIDGEGILLDREGGSVFRLNRTACEIWSAALAGKSTAEVSRDLASRFGLDHARATADVLAALERIPHVEPKTNVDPFRWATIENGYGFFENERLIARVDADGSTLRLGMGVGAAEQEVRGYLKSVVPKLLALRGFFVLHASAVEIDGKLRIFTGRSGAGKTTSARAFVRAGARLVSEDLLVLAPFADEPRAIVSGEPAIRAWIVEQAARLAHAPGEAIPCKPLDDCGEGPQVSIGEILLVDANRRAGEHIRLERLTRPDALVALIESAFFASWDTRQWLSRFVPLRSLVAYAATWQATMPHGLGELEIAVRDFSQRATMAS